MRNLMGHQKAWQLPSQALVSYPPNCACGVGRVCVLADDISDRLSVLRPWKVRVVLYGSDPFPCLPDPMPVMDVLPLAPPLVNKWVHLGFPHSQPLHSHHSRRCRNKGQSQPLIPYSSSPAVFIPFPGGPGT